jgi:hypothetical protein
VDEAYRAALLLEKEGIFPTVVNARFAKPIDGEALSDLSRKHQTLVTLEEHTLFGGFGSAVLEKLADQGISFARVVRLGVPDRFQTFGPREQLLADCGLDAQSIARRVASWAPASRANLLAAGAKPLRTAAAVTSRVGYSTQGDRDGGRGGRTFADKKANAFPPLSPGTPPPGDGK